DVGVLSGGGSSAVTPLGSIVEPSGIDRVWADRVFHPSSPLRAIEADAGAAHVEFLNGIDEAAAVAAAYDADLVVIFAEEWRAEGLDSQGTGLPDGQEQLIERVAAANPRTVVVIESGGAISVPWASKVPAVIAAFYPGGRGGQAVAGVLFGRVNPSGHLPVTFPKSIDQLPRPEQHDPATTTSNPNMERIGDIFEVSYDIEGSDVGYRWFEREQLTPAYPFGWGLSYTTFAFSGLDVTADRSHVVVTGTVTNTGDRAGATIVQVYASRRAQGGSASPDDFVSRLAAFARIDLKPGESKPVELHLEPRLLARWDVDAGAFRLAGGDYEVRIGAHALDEDGPTSTVRLQPAVLP
nr:glycoside hydrolase family 3 C-terminal domain-containing protein [Nocardioidaceae bacterium]